MSVQVTKSQRPVRSYRTGPFTTALRLLSLLAALAITGWILLRYSSLPGTIATHFDASGQPDDFGPRWSVLVLAGVMLALSVLLALLSRRPRAFNFPTEITERNAQAIYRDGERLMVWTLLGMQLVYAGIAGSVLLGGGAPLIAGGVAVMVGAVVVGVVRMVRA